jgi:hypothetical protein
MERLIRELYIKRTTFCLIDIIGVLYAFTNEDLLCLYSLLGNSFLQANPPDNLTRQLA